MPAAASPGSPAAALRKLWFQVHLWIGVGLSIVLIPISLTGALLVWHDGLDRLLESQRYRVTGAATRPLKDYAAAAAATLGADEPIAQIRLPEQPGAPVIVSAPMSFRGKPKPAGRPPQHNVWIDPGAARVLDEGSSNGGLSRFMHQLHGTLFIPEVGRKVVGWLGWLMLVSCLTGLWLWWPRTGALLKGFRWKRSPLFTGRLHHVVGFWIALPLAVLSFTGAYISFPQTMKAAAGAIVGTVPDHGARGRGEPAAGKGKDGERPREGGPGPRPRPLALTRLDPDQAVSAAALRPATGLPLAQVAWPTVKKAEWTITWREGERTVEVTVDDATGQVRVKPREDDRAQGMARVMRRLHDGSNLPFLWQVIIFLGGIAPAVLGVTGVWMWLRLRGGRKAVRAARASASGT
jgi:uncharacterized iron-regulated membrane protein